MPPSASIPHRILTNNMPSREEGRFHRENGWTGKLRLKLIARCKTWALRGKGFW
jgi:hypothetical protein